MTNEDAFYTLLDLVEDARGWSSDAQFEFQNALNTLGRALDLDVFTDA